MKKKIIIIVGVIIVIIAAITVIILTKKGEITDSESSYTDTKAITMTIENTLTSSGEVTSDTINKSLNTYKYFSKIYYEEGSYIKKGSKIVKYTNGTYYKAPYNLVLVSYNLPDSKDRISAQNYLQVKKLDTLEMSLTVDETEISKVSVGQEVNITLSAFEDKTYTGKITFINQIGSYSSSGTKYTAMVTFSNDGNVKIGMSGSVEVEIESVENAVAIPIEAVQSEDKEKYVLLVDDGGNTSKVVVETGISNAAYVEIISGLSEGDIVRMLETTTSSSSNRGQSGKNFSQNMGGGQMPSGGNFTPGNRE